MVKLDCYLQELIYDILIFCDKHSCSFENVIANDVQSIFQVTGTFNSFVAIFFTDFTRSRDLHNTTFDSISELGLNIGKLIRVSFAFRQKDDHDTYIANLNFNRDEITD